MLLASFLHNAILKFHICFYSIHKLGLSGKSCTHFICRITNYPVDKIIRSSNNWGQDYSSPYDILLSKVNLKSLLIRRLQNFMIILYKSLFLTYYPRYLRDMLTIRTSSYNLRGNYILDLPKAKTTTYCLHTFILYYLASKI